MLTMLNVNNNLLPSLLLCHLYMSTYEINPILCDDIHYIDSEPFNDTTKSASMLLEIEKHLKIVNASELVQRTIDS